MDNEDEEEEEEEGEDENDTEMDYSLFNREVVCRAHYILCMGSV